jgi:hypothetical protein
MVNMRQHWASGDLAQDLSRQARGRYAPRNNGNGFHV